MPLIATGAKVLSELAAPAANLLAGKITSLSFVKTSRLDTEKTRYYTAYGLHLAVTSAIFYCQTKIMKRDEIKEKKKNEKMLAKILEAVKEMK